MKHRHAAQTRNIGKTEIRHQTLKDMETLNDVAFLLLAKFDSYVRLENALAVSEYISDRLKGNIRFMEVGNRSSSIFPKLMPVGVKYEFVQDDDNVLHRTWYINRMLDGVKEKYVAIWDVDVIIPENQVYEAVNALKQGSDFSYPYEYDFLETSVEIRKMFLENKDPQTLIKCRDFMNRLYTPNPVGGVFFANLQSYMDCGKENVDFYGWGIEDGERYMRWLSQGKSISRVKGPLFHLTHPRGPNSTMPNSDDVVVKKRIYLSTLRGAKWKGF